MKRLVESTSAQEYWSLFWKLAMLLSEIYSTQTILPSRWRVCTDEPQSDIASVLGAPIQYLNVQSRQNIQVETEDRSPEPWRRRGLAELSTFHGFSLIHLLGFKWQVMAAVSLTKKRVLQLVDVEGYDSLSISSILVMTGRLWILEKVMTKPSDHVCL
jgi:hypothetical protein